MKTPNFHAKSAGCLGPQDSEGGRLCKGGCVPAETGGCHGQHQRRRTPLLRSQRTSGRRQHFGREGRGREAFGFRCKRTTRNVQRSRRMRRLQCTARQQIIVYVFFGGVGGGVYLKRGYLMHTLLLPLNPSYCGVFSVWRGCFLVFQFRKSPFFCFCATL